MKSTMLGIFGIGRTPAAPAENDIPDHDAVALVVSVKPASLTIKGAVDGIEMLGQILSRYDCVCCLVISHLV